MQPMVKNRINFCAFGAGYISWGVIIGFFCLQVDEPITGGVGGGVLLSGEAYKP